MNSSAVRESAGTLTVVVAVVQVVDEAGAEAESAHEAALAAGKAQRRAGRPL